MNRVVVSTVAVLVALVGFAMLGEDQEATAGLFGRKCCKPACCEPEPTCCEPAPCCPEPSCGCEAPCEPSCGCAAPCGCEGAAMEAAPEAAPAAPEAAPAAPEAPAT